VITPRRRSPRKASGKAGPSVAWRLVSGLTAIVDWSRVPLLEGVAANPELNLPDGIHPNARGTEIVARNVLAALQPLLPVSPGHP